MKKESMPELPLRLERLRRRFERWRDTREVRSRIPDALWSSAVKAVGRYGLHPTARALRLDYYSLKKRVEAADSDGEPDRPEVTTFVELAPPALGCPAECSLEWEHPGGAKMRVHLKGTQAPDLAALSRSFWGIEA